MTDQEIIVPQSWYLTTVKDACSLVVDCHNKTAPYTDSGIKLVRTSNIRNGKLDLSGVKYVNQKTYEYWSRRCKPNPGDVLFTREAPMGEVGMIPLNETVCMGQRMMLLRADNITLLGKYLLYSLQSPFNNRYIQENAIGTGVKHLRVRDVENFPIRVAPLPEQHRIVDKIEELFSDLDDGIASLKKAQQQLKVYRQAVLKWAFEGKLTAQWREEQKRQGKLESAEVLLEQIKAEREQRYQTELAHWQAEVEAWEANGKVGKKPGKPKTPRQVDPLDDSKLADSKVFPGSWRWEKLGNLADIVGGVTKGRKLEGKETISLPYLRVANVQDGYLDLSQIKYIDVLKEDLEKYHLEYGDILYTEGGDRDKLGRGTIWRNEIENCIHQNHIFRARLLTNGINYGFLAYFSRTTLAKDYFFKRAKQTVNLASINMTILSNFPIPVPSTNEQLQIVEEIESRLSICDSLEVTITENLDRAEALRQSILKQAFEGKLVPQDPNDEPASVLLERIRTSKSTQAEGNKPTKRKQSL